MLVINSQCLVRVICCLSRHCRQIWILCDQSIYTAKIIIIVIFLVLGLTQYLLMLSFSIISQFLAVWCPCLFCCFCFTYSDSFLLPLHPLHYVFMFGIFTRFLPMWRILFSNCTHSFCPRSIIRQTIVHYICFFLLILLDISILLLQKCKFLYFLFELD